MFRFRPPEARAETWITNLEECMPRFSRRMLRPSLLFAPLLLALADARPPAAGNGYITTCEGIGCYGHSSLCYTRTAPGGKGWVVTCYWPG